MRYFEKISKKKEENVSFMKRVEKHPVSFVLGGPAGVYGASDKNLEGSNFGKGVALGGGVLGAYEGAKQLGKEIKLQYHLGMINKEKLPMVKEYVNRRIAQELPALSPALIKTPLRRIATATGVGVAAGAVLSPLTYLIGKGLGKKRTKSEYK